MKKKKEMDIECGTFVTSMIVNIKNFEPNKIKINGIHTKIFAFTTLDT